MATLTPRIDNLEAGRNLIINGNFPFWQRTTSLSLSASSQFAADRFSAFKAAVWTGTSTYSQDSTLVPTFAQSGYPSTYSLKITNGTGASPGATDTYILRYIIEGYDYASIHGKPVRLQFWVRSSVTGSFPISFRNNAADRYYVATYTINSVNTWEKKTIDLTLDTLGTWLFDNGGGLAIQWVLGAGSSVQTSSPNTWVGPTAIGFTGMTQWAATTAATFNIAQVALIPGDFTNTSAEIPFRRAGKTISEELGMCQRYYYDPGFESSALNHTWGSGLCTSGTTLLVNISFPVSMRSTPTAEFATSMAVLNNAGTRIALIAGPTIESVGPLGGRFNASVASGLFAGDATLLQRNNSLVSKFSFSAEL